VKKEVLSCRYYEDFARFKAAIVECLEGIEGKHKEAIASLLTSASRPSKTLDSWPREV
jgi:hypothetical protein